MEVSLSPVAPRYGPRERLAQLGESRLSDAECIALILRTGARGETAEQLGQRMLRRFGGVAGLASARVHELAQEPRVGPVARRGDRRGVRPRGGG